VGVAARESLDGKALLVWVHGQLERYLPSCVKPVKIEAGKSAKAQEEEEAGRGVPRIKLLEEKGQHSHLLKPMGPAWERRARAGGAGGIATLDETSNGSAEQVNRNEYLFCEFALSVMNNAIKKEAIDCKDKVYRQMLDPFVPLLKKLLYSKHDEVVTLALKGLTLLLKADLPSVEDELPWVLKTVFWLLQRAGSTGSTTSQGCFKAVTVVLREPRYAQLLTQGQLKILLSFARQDMTEVDRQSVAFAMVRSIVDRRLVCTEVYDIMDVIGEHLVTAQGDVMRDNCSQTFIQFLLDYPLGEKRLQRHVSFLVENLEYEYESGRKAVLEVLHRLVTKLPEEILETYFTFIFLPLVARIVNDESAACRKMVGVLLKSLVARANRKQADALVDLVLGWTSSGEKLRKRAASQVMGLIIEQLGTSCDRYRDRLATSLSAAIAQGATQPDWEIVYYQMIAVEKLIKASPSIAASGDAKELGKVMSPLVLAHKHSWIKLSAGRVLGSLISGGKSKAGNLLEAAGGTFGVLKALCSQLAGEGLEERLGEQAVKNLVFLCSLVLASPELSPDVELEGELKNAVPSDDESGEEEEDDDDDDDDEEAVEQDGGEEDEEVSGGIASGSGKRRASSSGTKGSKGKRSKKDSSNGADATGPTTIPRAIKWVFIRLSHIARKHGGDRRSCVFRFFAAMAVKMGGEGFRPLLKQAVNPIFRAVETDQSGVSESCKELAQELVEMLQGLVGMKPFFDAYNAVRETRKKRIDQRKGEKALAKLLDPKGASQRRIDKNLKKRASAKRKIEGFKELRGAAEMKKSRRDKLTDDM